MKKILITGANSYIGDSVKEYLLQEPDKYSIDIIDTIGFEPKPEDFKGYDVVFNVAGIAHIKETPKNRDLYFKVNRDLSVKIAKASKAAGVSLFILLSSMSVYGKMIGHITKKTKESPMNAYGLSKAQADHAIVKLKDSSFKFACLRPPMVYGKGCKGNYQSLRTFALKSPIFPDYDNQRSMIYIGNLCEFVKSIIDEERDGLFFPQNADYVNTSHLVEIIAKLNGKSLSLTRLFNLGIKIMPVGIMKKVFGNLTYEKIDLVNKYSFAQSIVFTESSEDDVGETNVNMLKTHNKVTKKSKRKYKGRVVVLSNEHSWTYNLRKETLAELIKNGYEVILMLPYGDKIELLKEMGCKFIDLPMFERRGKNPVKELQLIAEYYKRLKRLRPDVVLTYTIKPNLYGGMVCSKLHIPYIANITGLGTAIDKKGVIQSAALVLYKLGLKKANCVFAQNKGNSDYLIKNRIVDANKVKQIPGSGVNLERFTVSDYPDDSICRFVFISRLLKEKGIEDYINAAKIVKKKYPKTEFHVCGFCEEDYKKRLEELEMEKYVIYHGMIDNVPEFLKDIHCLVHPSYYLEGTSNVCLEACASGRPVITTDHEGCRETVLNEKTGYIVPIQSPQVLAECIEKFIKLSYNGKKNMGLSAREYVETFFDRKIIVKAYMDEISIILL